MSSTIASGKGSGAPYIRRRKRHNCVHICVAAFVGLVLGLASICDAAGAWFTSDGGTGPWIKINESCVPPEKLRGGDFNGDGKTDVFTTWGGEWRVSFGGNTAWQIINTSAFDVSDLRFGDFNGDGKTDVFAAWGGKWHVSSGGTTSWNDHNTSVVGVADLRFGDWNGDGKTDVFASW